MTNQAKALEATTEKRDFKKEYEEAVKTVGLYHSSATNNSERVLNRLLDATIPSASADLYEKLAEASLRKDAKLVDSLVSQLKDVRDAESANLKSLAQLKKANSFQDVLIAFKDEVENLAYELALDVLKTTHVALNNAGQGSQGRKTGGKPAEEKGTREAAQYIVKKGGESITFTKRLGRGGANLKQDEAEFGFLGFKVVLNEENKDALEPSTIELNDGNHVPATRNNIIKAIEEQNAKSLEGYTAELIK